MARIDEQIEELEKQIATTKYNKKTQHAIGLYKARLAVLRDKREARSGGSKGKGFSVRKSGDASVVLLGFPSVGKSSLLNALTDKESDVGSYAFTTLTCIPGMLDYKGAKIQLLDVPGILSGAAAGTGRGKEVLQIVRGADLVLTIVDALHPEHYKAILKEVDAINVRINQKKPDIRIKKSVRGGLRIGKTVKLDMPDETIKGILRAFRINNADVLIRTRVTADQFIDAVEGNRNYVPGITALNKVDLLDKKRLKEVEKQVKPDISLSAKERTHMEELKELIFRRLELMPIYCKQIGTKADTEEPLILKKGAKVEDMCNKLHKDFVKRFNYAKVWGPSARFGGQKLGLRHKIKEGDIVELHVR